MVLLRHGESKWNFENRFTGWTDVDLTTKGINEAKNAGLLLNKERFDFIYTSVLKRAIQTMEICLETINHSDIPIEYDWRLNERHYGALQGLNKTETAKKYGDKQVLLWRRSYKTPPPLLAFNDKRHPRFNLKYKHIDSNKLPKGESLKNTVNRVMPLWKKNISPKILSGKQVLIVAHGNSIRAIVKILDNVSNDEIVKINIPTGIPLIYELDKNLNTINSYYLGTKSDLEKGLANVINQGKSK